MFLHRRRYRQLRSLVDGLVWIRVLGSNAIGTCGSAGRIACRCRLGRSSTLHILSWFHELLTQPGCAFFNSLLGLVVCYFHPRFTELDFKKGWFLRGISCVCLFPIVGSGAANSVVCMGNIHDLSLVSLTLEDRLSDCFIA